jgi:hypothetical protein
VIGKNIMNTSVLVSFAIIKSNYDLDKDYLDNFVPFVAECIRVSGEDVINLKDVQDSMKILFGLNLPQNIIKILLKKLHKKRLLRIINGIYYPNSNLISQLNFRDVQGNVLRYHELLINDLISFCSTSYEINWSNEQAEEALISFINANHLIVKDPERYVNIIVNSDDSKEFKRSNKFIIASFIQYLYKRGSSGKEYLETIIKGNMLANSIYLPFHKGPSRNFDKTEIFFDTRFLIHALGYAGEARQAPCIELLELLYENGAELRCFDHTFDEILGILNACSHRIKTGHLKGYHGESLQYFIEKDYSAADIEIFMIDLKKNLENIGIFVTKKPEYIYEYNIDEDDLAHIIDTIIDYRTESPFIRDVDSISAIIRYRQGKEYYYIEDCPSIFITTNTRLFKASCKFYYKTASQGSIAPSLTDYTLTNILWLKQPNRAPDLPIKRIIADSYAAIQPSDSLFNKYLLQIDRLQESGEIDPNDAHLAMYSLHCKQALMNKTLGEEDALTEGTVREILDYVHCKIKEDLEKEIKQKDEEISQINLRELERKKNIDDLAKKISRWATEIIGATILLTLIIGYIYSMPWGFPPVKSAMMQYSFAIVWILLIVFSILSNYFGTTIKNIKRRINNKIKSKVKEIILRRIGP